MIFSLLFSFLLFTSKGFFSNGFLFALHRSFFFLVFRVFLIFPSGEAQHINWANCFLQICDRRCIIAKIAFIPDFIRNSHIFFCIFTVIFSPIQAFFGTKIVTSSNWHVSTVGGALRSYRRVHGFKSRKGLNSFFFFFQVLFSLLLM